MLSLATALAFVDLFFGGILAGMEIVIHYGLRAPSEVLNEPSQLQLRQALVLRLRVLVPAFFAPTLLSAIAISLLERSAPGASLHYVGLAALLIWIGIRVVGTVPINSATLTWKLESPPKNWKAQIDHAERFHVVGVWMVVAAFATFLMAEVLR